MIDNPIILDKVEIFGELIKDLRNYKEEDLDYIASKLEKAYDELCKVVYGEDK